MYWYVMPASCRSLLGELGFLVLPVMEIDIDAVDQSPELTRDM